MNLKKLIKSQKETKSRKLYEKIENKFFPDANKCKICNQSIFYYNSTFKINKNGLVIKDKMTKTDESYKTIFDKKYYLSICENCMIKNTEYSLCKNKSRIFNQISDITCYAFGIPKNVQNLWNSKKAVTLENLIARHGEKIGKEKWESYKNKQAYVGCKRDYFIEKYGYTKGIIKYKEVCDSKKLTISNFIKKYGKIKGPIKFNEFLNKKNAKYSKISQTLFNDIHKLFPQHKKYFGETEFGKLLENNTYVKLDFYMPDINLAIEFNGDIFHANPKFFDANDKPNVFNKKMSAKEIWEKDQYRYKNLKKLFNIDTIVIWEDDYKTDPNNIIQYLKKIICERLKLNQ